MLQEASLVEKILSRFFFYDEFYVAKDQIMHFDMTKLD